MDSVDCVVAYEEKDLSPPPSGEASNEKDFLTGVARDKNYMTLILNMAAVLNMEDYKALKNPAKEQKAA